MIEARFVAFLEEPLITRKDGVEVVMTVKPSSLGRIVRLAVFTGAGKLEPRKFSVRIASKMTPGVVCQGWLQELKIQKKGEAKVVLLLEKPDLKGLQGLMNKTVGVEVRDAGSEE